MKDLNNQILLIKALSALKIETKSTQATNKHQKLIQKVEEKEKLNYKLEDLLRSEVVLL